MFKICAIMYALPASTTCTAKRAGATKRNENSRGSVIPVNIHASVAESKRLPACFFFSGFAHLYIASAAPGSPKIMKINSPEKYLVASALKCAIFAESASCAKKMFCPPSTICPATSIVPPTAVCQNGM